MNLNPLLLSDFYKQCHFEMYPKNLTKLVSYYTPRMSRIAGDDKLTMFGLQAFLKEYMIAAFNQHFFGRPKEEVVSEYIRLMRATLGYDANASGVSALYDLGYLPLEIRAVPEGCRVNMHVPMIEISNTHPDFVWLVNAIETQMSATLWHTMLSANVGVKYRNIVNRFYQQTVDPQVPRSRALGDFSMRGQESIESAIKSSAAFCLSFLNTATVPAIPWLEKNYLCNSETDAVAYGAISTEHSVMCSNYSVDGDQVTFLKRLLHEIYPHSSFSVVSDSYDYWDLVENILPTIREDILNHDGCMLIRGDSGDPVDIVTKTVFKLYELFGGEKNSKGYIVLNPHIKAIYGDSITPTRCEQIYTILKDAGFACNNVSLGVGSFSMQCLENANADGSVSYSPYTRDTYGVAIKATYAENASGNPIMIFKNPKTDTGHFKKSQRGCCSVHFDGNDFVCVDGLTLSESRADPANMLIPVFRDGHMLQQYSLSTIRRILWNGTF